MAKIESYDIIKPTKYRMVMMGVEKRYENIPSTIFCKLFLLTKMEY